MNNKPKSKRGFASMDIEKHRKIASMGGRKISDNREHMAAIGSKGGKAHSSEHMSRIGKIGGEKSNKPVV